MFEFNAVLHFWKKFVEYEREKFQNKLQSKRIDNLRTYLEKAIKEFEDSNKPLILEAKYGNYQYEDYEAIWNWKNILVWFKNLNKITIDLEPHMFFKIKYTEKFINQPLQGHYISDSKYLTLIKKFQPNDCRTLPNTDFNIFCSFTPEERKTCVLNLKWNEKEIEALFRLVLLAECLDLDATG